MKANHSRVLLAALMVTSVSAVATLRAAQAFDWTNLVSDIPGVTHTTDANLVNPWGIAPGLRGTVWVANNGTGTLTVYNLRGRPFPINSPLVVTVPPPPGSVAGTVAAPTGLVLNHHALKKEPGDDFVISAGGKSGPSLYLVATEDGTIAGYNDEVDATNAILAVDHSGAGAIYKGLAVAWDGNGHHRLYATNFHAGTIEAFDSQFQQIVTTGRFTDPNPVAGFAPFNIKAWAQTEDEERTRYLIVTYAQQDANAEDDVAGPGLGYINLFDRDGTFVKRLVDFVTPGPGSPDGNGLNAPWGLAIARPPFGRPDGALLVGNFGDGTIHRFRLGDLSGTPLGSLNDRNGNPLKFDGLWGLHFMHPGTPSVNGVEHSQPTVALYFTAGIVDEAHGLMGVIVHR